MTWLDENDESIIELNRLGLLYSFRTKEAERMARVLREQSAYIKASHNLEAACLDFNPVDIDKLRKAQKDAWNNMSDDAKELLAGHHS